MTNNDALPLPTSHPMYSALRAKLGEPGEWQLLFTRDGSGYIDSSVRRVHTGQEYANPTFPVEQSSGQSPLQSGPPPDCAGGPKPLCAFVREGASIPVLHDWETIELFAETGRLSEMPRFLRAGEQPYYRFNPSSITVGVLIAGGPAAGLNMNVDSIVKRHFALATQQSGGIVPGKLRIVGYDGGYEGLLHARKCLLAPTVSAGTLAYGHESELPIRATDSIAAQEGASIIKAGRGSKGDDSNALAQRHAAAIEAEGLDILYVIGGNGTLGWAGRISEELQFRESSKRVAIVGGPKTMDLDICFADATFGFRTAVDQATAFVAAMNADAAATDRLAVLEVFGAGVGRVALHACYDSGEGDYALIPELVPVDVAEYGAFMDGVLEHIEARINKNGHAVLVVAEGALPGYRFGDSEAREKAFALLMERLRDKFGAAREAQGLARIGISDVRSRYLVRATPPNTYDIELCKVTGKLMVDTALAGFTGCAVQRWQNTNVLVPFSTATGHENWVPIWDYFLQTFLDRLRLTGAPTRTARQSGDNDAP